MPMGSAVPVLMPHGSEFEVRQLHLHSETPPHLSMMSYDGALLLVIQVLLSFQYSNDFKSVVHSFQIELCLYRLFTSRLISK